MHRSKLRLKFRGSTGKRQQAETTRQAALSLGTEADHAEIKAWAHEIRAWIALTTGNYHGVIAAAHAGVDAAPHHSVAIQLFAQEAKAWATLGDRRSTEVALDKGRRLLEVMPYPDNLDHHFVVDPTKYDFYMMDCYRHLAEDRMAETRPARPPAARQYHQHGRGPRHRQTVPARAGLDRRRDAAWRGNTPARGGRVRGIHHLLLAAYLRRDRRGQACPGTGRRGGAASPGHPEEAAIYG
jgi:hypothetical protein